MIDRSGAKFKNFPNNVNPVRSAVCNFIVDAGYNQMNIRVVQILIKKF